jgi:hypothetical protein
VQIKCNQCIWFRDCRREGRDELADDGGMWCDYYDGLVDVAGLVTRNPKRDELDYDEDDLALGKFHIYIEGIGWVQCDPYTVRVK